MKPMSNADRLIQTVKTMTTATTPSASENLKRAEEKRLRKQQKRLKDDTIAGQDRARDRA